MRSLRPWAAVCAAVAFALLTTTLTPASSPAAASPPGGPAFSPHSARAALARLLPRHASQITLVPARRPASGDWFGVSGRAGHV
ncbi:alpha-N-acetylglucosaminidase, partial [Streptomyces sp. SID6013]|nr:alpha-N-acetylglucosaminidase [Streptomyces sp. SID6013]